MDTFFPSFCSVCDKTLDGCGNGLYCSEACRLCDSAAGRAVPTSNQSSIDDLHIHNCIDHHHHHHHSIHKKVQSHSPNLSSSKQPPFSLHYPSLFTPHSFKSSPIKLEDHYLPGSMPELSISEDEESLLDDYDIPALSLDETSGFLHR